ncbi:ferric reductase-like transmembrane domain-containing protein [Lysinibacillus endophyticus]|uniref:ferric reductase-like transmembrane domain-containing protein n=1 Tax=Ureibacillus endophyticus TaxID=1978490 RepID=UPI00209FACA6|nr:ferric reductase-like transmembrane domain-containing protein [Lysinibacillus endophyticus]MCP1145031.1 ferric reductase-like transmembrane domain-containing protein [Lysinibacillus endophyticus]
MFISNWEWIRLLGFLAYFNFTISIVFGLLRKSTIIKKNKNLVFHIHQVASWMGLFTLIGHMLLLILDKFEPFTIGELLIPFKADYETVFSTLGTIAFYLFLFVIFNSDLWIRKLGFSLWKKSHFLVFPAWIFSLLHSIFLGTDSERPMITVFYGISVCAVVLLLLLRAFSHQRLSTHREKGVS